MNGPKKAWPTDAVMILCESPDTAPTEKMQSAQPCHCRDCGRELVVDGALLQQWQGWYLYEEHPIMFLCRECYDQYEQPDLETGPWHLDLDPGDRAEFLIPPTHEHHRKLLDQMLEQLDGEPLTITLTLAEALALAGLVEIAARVEQQISRSEAARAIRTKLRKQLPNVCLRLVDAVGQTATQITLRQMLFTAAESVSRN